MRITSFLLTLLISIILLLTTLSAEVKTMGLDLMPIPTKIFQSDGKFRLSDSFKVTVKGNAGDRISKGVARTLGRLSERSGLFFSQGVVASASRVDNSNFIIHCRRPGKLVLLEDESYKLIVSPEKIELTAETDIGALWGLETFLQLVATDSIGYYLPAVTIEDQPRFPWRGLLIDVGRHFMPVEVIKRNLDGMMAVKMNVLHWHLTEDQGFRIECKTWPRLQERGSDGLYYTHEQIREIVAYAADRGIRVVPEFDVPGHTTSWFVGYPELASAPGPYQISRKWGVHDAVMDPTQEITYKFLEKFFREMANLFPDKYVHIGGDENNGVQWNANPEIQAFKKTHGILDNQALQSYFNRKIQKILVKYDKIIVGWDEIFHSDLPTDIVIQSWRGRASLYESVKKGYPAILSHGYYIDLIQPTDYHYLNDPIPDNAPLSDEEKQLILGGEVTMWSEFVSAENIDSRIWPRTAAIAERFWSPGNITDVADMYRRLELMSWQLEELGLTHEKNYEMMLRRLTKNTDIVPLKTLVDVIEPVKIYTRALQRDYTSFSPLTRVVDAARPDAKVARNFRQLVDHYVTRGDKSNGKLKVIKELLSRWRNNHSDLAKTIKASPILKEIEALSYDLSSVAGIGLETFNYLENGSQADNSWVKNKLSTLEKAKAPRGQAELMIISAIEQLVKQAGNVNN